jgi:hypothetical protein
MFAWVFGSIFAIVFVGGIVGLSYVSESSTLARQLRQATMLKVAEIEDGQYVRLVGRARCETPLTAPYTHRSCVAYRAEVLEKTTDGVNYLPAAVEENDVDFEFEDETGSILVIVENASYYIFKDARSEEKNFKKKYRDADQDILRILRERGTKKQGRFLGWEGVLEVGEEFALCGTAVLEPDPRPATAQPGRLAQTRLVLRAMPGKPMVISDEYLLVSGEKRQHKKRIESHKASVDDHETVSA